MRKLNIKEVDTEKNLIREDGWVGMEIQFLCNKERMGSKNCVIGRTILKPGGGAHELHIHPNAEEVMYIIKGHGRAISGEEEFEIGPGDLVFIPEGDRHFVENTDSKQEMEMIWVYAGGASLEEAGYETL